MSNEEVLEKFEKENEKGDEGLVYYDTKAALVTVIVMIFLCAIALVVIKDAKTFALILGIVLTGYGIGDLYRFNKSKNKRMLLTGISLTILGIVFYLSFFAYTLGWI